MGWSETNIENGELGKFEKEHKDHSMNMKEVGHSRNIGGVTKKKH